LLDIGAERLDDKLDIVNLIKPFDKDLEVIDLDEDER
jgi:hypothetical protein